MDIVLRPDNSTQYTIFDLIIDNGQVLLDGGLYSAVALSLFCDQRATDDDDISGDPRGWWADYYNENPGDQYGSRLWVLRREKQTDEVAALAEEYATDALVWLVDEGIARTINVIAEWVEHRVLGIAVYITKPDNQVLDFQFHYLWENVHGV